MIVATVYNVASGSITKFVNVTDDDLVRQIGDGQSCIVGKWAGDEYYILDGQPTPRTDPPGVTLSSTDVATGAQATLTGLPDPCWLNVNGVEVEVIGGSHSFSGRAELIGQYKSVNWVVAEHDLAALKAKVKDRIDAAAETTRLKYITGGAGQAMVYQQKVEEAKVYQTLTGADDSDFPILYSEATATGVTVAALAAAVLTVTGQWVALAAQIEGLRMGAKKAAGDATTIYAVLAAENISWP